VLADFDVAAPLVRAVLRLQHSRLHGTMVPQNGTMVRTMGVRQLATIHASMVPWYVRTMVPGTYVRTKWYGYVYVPNGTTGTMALYLYVRTYL
jgi:hypothetical protein